MHVINVAASAYQWTNVAYYDITFHQLMAFKPNRSWAKTYHQGWNLKEPLGLTKVTNHFNGYSGSTSQQHDRTGSGPSNSRHDLER